VSKPLTEQWRWRAVSNMVFYVVFARFKVAIVKVAATASLAQFLVSIFEFR